MADINWKILREDYWKDLDVYSDDLAPEARESHIVHRIFVDSRRFPQVNFNPVHLFLAVARDGLAHVEDNSMYFGKRYKDMTQPEQGEVLDYLLEWEYVEYRRVGPEDSELFATEKLKRVETFPYDPENDPF